MRISNIYGQEMLNTLYQVNRELMLHRLHLATGRSMVSASESPAVYAIAKELEGIGRRWEVAGENVGNALNLYSTAETGAVAIGDILTRMSELTIQASSDLLSPEERATIQQELQSLASEIDQTVEQTQWRGQKLLSGEYAQGKQILVGPSPEDAMAIAIGSNAPNGIYWQEISGIPISGIDVSSTSAAQDLLQRIRNATATVSDVVTEIGSFGERLDQKEVTIPHHRINVLASYSRLADADMAYESLRAATSRILQSIATNALAQNKRILPGMMLEVIG